MSHHPVPDAPASLDWDPGPKPAFVDQETWECVVRLITVLRAGERLASDLDAAVAQYKHGATPTAHVKLILQRYHERLPEPREVDPYERSGYKLMDRVVASLRLLGVTSSESALVVLTAAGTNLSDRERAYILAQLDGGAS